ncbi:50S ribosomal protein L17 [Heyndrickxia coagulans]|uniref:Large ribosomal subunit protein bL17 n=2 Tax=Heyndrickxia coagulans TaxID=1398 RepID=A0A8B4BY04_HEYCO|nr:50S ribosomal protein L17 [Heyndrickxia coagulans]AJH77922.1 ribosomal protein L17 [Heyndrickxia coagulans DSM 1 = ATCC 7050]MBF8417955.1 50S ribosomal protein L17 [Heyndrickxia coagulans]MCR2846185.1 50S ribosomal protein L17 [Heyndrickxia coagulans]MDR4223774.1 50S ribosomal protein L17 [Heyndrickxia coagulans DSM 1 = ATCC 7050]MED4311410.1 50S ribosomal protein L17 [Heyndrickxia coagulans]
MPYRKLGRTSAQRKALLRDLATDLIINERIETTEARAKELRSVVEKLVTLGKRGDLHARRQAAAYVRHETADAETKQDAVQKLFSVIAERYADRQGGYTRILKVGPRRGDGAPVAIIEFVEKKEQEQEQDQEQVNE